jgi:hypothetical protein
MGTFLACCATLLVLGVLAAPAGAQKGGGLYEPFPEPAPDQQVRGFIRSVPGGGRDTEPGLSDEDLKRGTVVPRAGLRSSSAAGAASARAGVGEDTAFLAGWEVVLALSGLAALGAVVALRRRR